MIDEARLARIRLSRRPIGQRIFATLLIWPNYRLWPRRTHIVLEGEENLPRGGGAVLVMNHTDRYNYWPLQFAMWRRRLGYTATWVKGKYYENPLLAWFMDATNNIPLPSRGYVLTKDFLTHIRRRPTDQEYQALKRHADGQLDEAAAIAAGGEAVRRLLSLRFLDAPSGRYLDSLELRFARMMEQVARLSEEALRIGLFLLIFPEGTRAKRLGRGHVGAAQLILHAGVPVVPIGCSGSDQIYPGDLPISRGGTVTYRIGAPLTPEGELARFRIAEPFTPFQRSAERHAQKFRALTDLLMERINDLLDPAYQSGGPSEDADRTRRFV